MSSLPTHLVRFLTVALARAAATLALVLSALLVATDSLDPSARAAPAAEVFWRAPSLVAVSLVVAALLSPAVALSSLERSGALRALRAAGCDLGRAVAPWSLLTASALALGAFALSALPTPAGVRPPPLAVTPFGAPHTGRWRFSAEGARFELASRKPLPDSHFREPVAARDAPARGGTSTQLPLCAEVGAALVAVDLARSGARSLRRLWAVSATVLLAMVVASVLLANARATGH